MDDIFKNLHLQLSSEDVEKIDAWKAKNGMKSRSEAIRSIIRIVIDEEPQSKSMREKNNNNFITPNSNNNDIKRIVRDLVKEEMDKMNK